MLWSVAVGFIIVMWTIGVLGAGTTGFIQQYTFVEVLREIATDDGSMFWPGEFGGYRWQGSLIQVSPILPLLMWPLCIMRSLRWWQRLTLLTLALAPTLLAIYHPAAFVMAPVLLASIFGTTDGEYWQDGSVVFPAMSLWFWMIIVLMVLTVVHGRSVKPNSCPTCGYSTIGLPSDICPECGASITPSAASP